MSARRVLQFIAPWLAGAIVVALAWLGIRAFLHSPNRGLPYHDSFARAQAGEWKAFGGTWELVDGSMRNNSDERGAKLLAGSPYWHNYSIEADVNLPGSSGDAGLILRSSDEEKGVNAYSGYYAGIRTLDSTLVLGRAEHGWEEVNKQSPLPGGIRPFQWYHLKLLAFNCQIVAAVTAPPQATQFSLSINDPTCLQSGRVGLRSYSAGGIWRNVVVRPASLEDLTAMLRTTQEALHSDPRRATSENDEPSGEQSRSMLKNASQGVPIAQSIESLRLSSLAQPQHAAIRGVVVLTSPMLFVQDSTGGVYIPQPHAPPLQVGDEVEVSGEVHPGEFSSTLEHATVQRLWARTPAPPVSVTVSQASTGKYDATFIEVHGHLVAKERGPDNTLVLDLDEGPQSFRAIMSSGRSDALFSSLNLNSSLSLRGICVVDSAFTHNLTPFVILLRSGDDLEVLAGPPWWSTGHVIAMIVASLVLALIVNFVYHRVAHWRLQGVLEERQRLAHEMHDTLAQSFAGIGFQLQAIRNRLSEPSASVSQQLDLASELVRHSHEEARRSIATLRPETLESGDILSSLEQCARRMVEGGMVHVIVEREGDQRSIPLRTADTLYRIGQEAIANAVRHARPTQITIRLSYCHDQVSLQIEDNGIGFEHGNGLGGFGIRGMKRRAQTISAEFQLDSQPGAGTRIRIHAALPPRITLLTLPKHSLRFLKEQWADVRTSK